MVLSPLLHGEINFIDQKKETVKPSLCHSYRSSFKRQVIALPLHGQNTAAVKLLSQGRQDLLFISFARGGVFGKQARLVFAEFLLFLLVFPCKQASVGLTVVCWKFFLLFVFFPVPALIGAGNVR